MKACEGSGGTAPPILESALDGVVSFHAPAALVFQKNFCTDSLGGWIGHSRDFQAFSSVGPFSRLKCFRNSVPVFQLEICAKQEKNVDRGFFLLLFAKLRKATVSFVISVCLSVRMEQLGCHWTDFHEI
jgi:hypothetical protein